MNKIDTTRTRPRGMTMVPADRAAATGPDAVPAARHYWRIALRWKWVIAGCIVGALVLGLIVTLLSTKRYTASTTIEIARESNKIVNLQGVEQEASDADQEFYQTQYGLLQSRSLAERVATELKLVDNPDFFEMFGKDPEDPTVGAGAARRYGAQGRPKRLKLAGEVLLKHVDVNPTRLSRLVEISFTSPDQTLSARVANAWSTNFIQASLERRYQASSYARNFLERRLEQLRQRLASSERQLVAYAGRQRIINLPTRSGPSQGNDGERSIVAENLAALNQALAEATADRIKAQSRFDEQGGAGGTATEALNNDAINSIRAKRAEYAADYQKMLTTLEPGYPAAQELADQIRQLDRSIAAEELRVSRSLRASYREAEQRENRLNTRVQGLEGDLLDLRRRSIQYNIYQREVDTNRTLYDGLLQRYKEIGITGGVGVNNVAVVDQADVPEKPSSPRLLLNLAIALVLGCAAGAGAALLLEQLDESFADPEEVQRRLGVPLLGQVPKLVGREPADALDDRKSELVDAYLAVQSNLEFATERGLPRSFSVTSTRPAEGKSTTALALATSLARGNRSVVLIDADMRSPSVHQLLGTTHERGLSNFLAGSDDLESLLIPAPRFGFTAMTAGPLPPNAAELLSGERLALLVERLTERFDVVVFDSPPVMGLADAPMIASRVEAVVYAVESHGIRSSQVRTALARMESANARVVGAVLTKFESKRAHHGYGYDYGYDYGRKSEGRSAG